MRPQGTSTLKTRSGDALVVNGWESKLSVRRGQLRITQGYGPDRVERSFPRAVHGLARVVVIAGAGNVSLDAIGWLSTQGVGLIVLGRDGRLLLTSETGSGDPRLRRAQALVTSTNAGVEIVRGLLKRKVAGQRQLYLRLTGDPSDRAAFDLAAADLDRADSFDGLRLAEAQVALRYWTTFAAVPVRFRPADRERIPPGWLAVGPRRSPITGRARQAVTPAHAIANFLYTVGEAEARLAILALGMDPLLGLSHVDKLSRSSLALDLLEPLRPTIDAYLLDLLQTRTFSREQFAETPQGSCRLRPALLGELAATAPAWARLIAPTVEQVAQQLADASGTKIGRVPTRLTSTNRRAGRAALHDRAPKTPRVRVPQPEASCRVCAEKLPAGQELCDTCRPGFERQLLNRAIRRAGAAAPAATRSRADGAGRHLERREWASQHGKVNNTAATQAAFARDVLPLLQGASLQDLRQATGLTGSYLALIRAGRKTPHPRHWTALLGAVETCRDSRETPLHSP